MPGRNSQMKTPSLFLFRRNHQHRTFLLISRFSRLTYCCLLFRCTAHNFPSAGSSPSTVGCALCGYEPTTWSCVPDQIEGVGPRRDIAQLDSLTVSGIWGVESRHREAGGHCDLIMLIMCEERIEPITTRGSCPRSCPESPIFQSWDRHLRCLNSLH